MSPGYLKKPFTLPRTPQRPAPQPGGQAGLLQGVGVGSLKDGGRLQMPTAMPGWPASCLVRGGTPYTAAVTFWLLLACSDIDPARANLQAARVAESNPEAAAKACESLPRKEAGECLALTAAHLVGKNLPAARGLCERITDNLWADECWFWMAEAVAEVDGPVAGAKLCRRAGRFARNCVGHLWMGSANTALASTPDDPAGAWALHAPSLAWSEGLEDKPPGALVRRHRDTFFEARHNPGSGSETAAPIDLAWCLAFESTLAKSCRQAGASILQRRLNRAHPQGLSLDALCGEGALADRVKRATGVTWVPDPLLDQRATSLVQRACRQKEGSPGPAGAPARGGDRP